MAHKSGNMLRIIFYVGKWKAGQMFVVIIVKNQFLSTEMRVSLSGVIQILYVDTLTMLTYIFWLWYLYIYLK